MARIFRRHPDSSYLTAPRVFARVFCAPDQLVGTVRFYEQLTGEQLDMDADLPEAGRHVVAVGSFLVLALEVEGDGLAAQTAVTVLNANVERPSPGNSPPGPRSFRNVGNLPWAPA